MNSNKVEAGKKLPCEALKVNDKHDKRKKKTFLLSNFKLFTLPLCHIDTHRACTFKYQKYLFAHVDIKNFIANKSLQCILFFSCCFYHVFIHTFFSPICDYVVEIFFHANDSGLKYPKKTLYLDNKILV